MKNLLPKIDTTDGLFHNGNPATGEQGTRVTETWLNDVQDRLRDVQAEAHYVLQKAGFKPKAEIQTQLYDAIVKIIEDNRRSSGITQKGEVQLTNDYNGESEVLGLTQKAGKALKALIDSLTRSLSNYIPNSKKSNAVNSPSSDTIATSAAVKTAYDKGAEAKTAADNANTNANRRAFGLALSDEDLNNVTAPGIYGQNANINSTAARHYPIQQAGKLMVTGSSGYGAQQLYIPFDSNYIYARGRNASNNWNDWKRIDGLNRVSKDGDTMTGNLVIDTADSLLKGQRRGVNKYAVGLRNSTSNDIVVVNYTDNTVLELLANSVYSNKTLVAPGMILEGADWTGFNLKNLSGRYVRVEGNPHSAENMLTILYREANGTNINIVSLRKKGGTIALLEDASPAGLVAYFASTSAPTGWLKANGAAVSRTTYAALFAAIGTTFGAGDGRTTFNLPDLRGEFLRSLDDGRNIDPSRRLGSWQKGTIEGFDGLDATSVFGVGLVRDSAYNTLTLEESVTLVGADHTTYDDVREIALKWAGGGGARATNNPADRDGGFWTKNNKNLVKSSHFAGMSRPRNVALLACIKY
ncbi:tail fiber protein [Rodentibacter pneumotropicus]|uniref:tail fiber protein n=1 Tax=Rodentibacter pneumotropicus TaxID=758 RepID=UPI00192E0572|nr:tail fiber protein [Rodentibacter pneumotropicus]